eukprot:78635-Pyramimonas_sp.AAC.1
MLAAAMPEPMAADAPILTGVCKFLKGSSEQKRTIWTLDAPSLTFATASDSGGAGAARRGGARGAWIAMAADGGALEI